MLISSKLERLLPRQMRRKPLVVRHLPLKQAIDTDPAGAVGSQ
jgi:hypothetical protein